MKKYKKRKCPICDSSGYKNLYFQPFAGGLTHHVVVCNNCHFTFVNNTPDQKYYDKYYEKMSKYELERDQVLHKAYKDLILENFSKSTSILDIGCSTGHLLYLLKKEGFGKMTGIDPSPACRKIAQEKFGISIQTASISSFKSSKKFDLIILSMILEHLQDVKNSLKHVDKFLKREGYLLITVPDAGNFYNNFEEPFGEFSVEHINFYTIPSLLRLLRSYQCNYIKTDNKNIYSLWKKGSSFEDAISRYIKLSEKKLQSIRKTIDEAPAELVVWGVGSLTQRLFCSTNLSKKAVILVDSDGKLWGKELGGKKIISPKNLDSFSQPIFISSFRFKDEIIDIIKKMKLKNKIITF